jgi:hypothetical protein
MESMKFQCGLEKNITAHGHYVGGFFMSIFISKDMRQTP